MADYRRKRWRNEMAVRVDVNGALESLVGEGGLRENELAALEQHVAGAHAAMDAKRKSKAMRFRDLPYEKREVQKVLELAREVKSESDTLVVLGIGGSVLGTRALYGALRLPFHAAHPGSEERGARLIIAANVDPSGFGARLHVADP